MTSDLDLLGQFAREKSQDAFTALVQRHVNLVYSAALRQVHSPQLAEEIVQSVFADLAQNANKLCAPGGSLVLTAWLYQVTRRTAIDVIRKESRRQLREQIAVEMNAMNATADSSTGVPPVWTDIEAHLDDAMAALDETDRTAILLRYFENRSLREVGAALGTSDDAAQKRVGRAVERLREFFSKQKVTVGASGLAVLISANAVQAAPIGLAATISTAITLTTTTLGMTMIHKILIAGFAAAAIGSGIYSVHLQKQIGALEQEQTSLNQQIVQLIQERDAAKNQLAALKQENEQLRDNETELLKLRGEVGRLWQQQNVSPSVAQSATDNSPRAEKTTIRVGTKFASIPSEDLQSLGVSWISDAQGDRTGLLTEQQFKIINEALQGASDANVISAPTIITINGERATISATRAATVFDTNVNTGTTLDVTPYFSTNSSTFDLKLKGQLVQLTGDPSQPGVQTIQITNQLTLSPGQTVVLEQYLPDGGWMPGATNVLPGPRSLLMFVTPTIVNARDYQRNGQRVAAIWKSPTNSDSPDFPNPKSQ